MNSYCKSDKIIAYKTGYSSPSKSKISVPQLAGHIIKRRSVGHGIA